MVAALDWAVGAVTDALKDSGFYDNTVIIYTSDNGAQPGRLAGQVVRIKKMRRG